MLLHVYPTVVNLHPIKIKRTAETRKSSGKFQNQWESPIMLALQNLYSLEMVVG